MPASAGASAAALRSSLVELLEPVVVAAGYDLEDVSASRAGRRSIVRVVVDADGGIDLDAVAEVSRVVSDALDSALEHDDSLSAALAGSYTLEVTSPGVDRPLNQPRHWRRAIGRLVTVDAAGKQVLGRVTDVDEDGVALQITGRNQRVPWTRLGPGKVQVEFNRPGGKDR